MQTINEVAEACALLRKEFSDNEDFREAFIASVGSAIDDSFRTFDVAISRHDYAETIAKRIMDVE